MRATAPIDILLKLTSALDRLAMGLKCFPDSLDCSDTSLLRCQSRVLQPLPRADHPPKIHGIEAIVAKSWTVPNSFESPLVNKGFLALVLPFVYDGGLTMYVYIIQAASGALWRGCLFS